MLPIELVHVIIDYAINTLGKSVYQFLLVCKDWHQYIDKNPQMKLLKQVDSMSPDQTHVISILINRKLKILLSQITLTAVMIHKQPITITTELFPDRLEIRLNYTEKLKHHVIITFSAISMIISTLCYSRIVRITNLKNLSCDSLPITPEQKEFVRQLITELYAKKLLVE